jgi:hypothetical protein
VTSVPAAIVLRSYCRLHSSHVHEHGGHGAQLAPWKLEADDTKLLDLLPFLEAVVRTAVPDVRAVVRSYEGQDIPTAFKCGPRPLKVKHWQTPPLTPLSSTISAACEPV